MRDIKVYQAKVFEKIKNINENGMEYWLARDLANISFILLIFGSLL